MQQLLTAVCNALLVATALRWELYCALPALQADTTQAVVALSAQCVQLDRFSLAWEQLELQTATSAALGPTFRCKGLLRAPGAARALILPVLARVPVSFVFLAHFSQALD